MAHRPPHTTAAHRIAGPPDRPPPDGRRRAARDLRWLLLVTCAVPVAGSAADFALLAGAPADGWSGAVLPWLRLLCSLATGCWLARLVADRTGARPARRPGQAPERGRGRGRGQGQGQGQGQLRTVLALTALACAARFADLIRAGEAQSAVGGVATTVLLAWLCGELAVSHGAGWRGLGVAPSGARTPQGRLTAVLVFGAVFVLAYTTVVWMAHLRMSLPAAAPWLPVLHEAQSSALGWRGPADMVANVLFTGIAEEMVLVGAVVVLGRAAGRPLWALCALSLLLRVAGHLYLGVPGVALVLLGACSLFLYLHRGRLVPLVAGHIAYDLAATLAPSPEALNTWVLGVLLGTGAAFAAWLHWFAPAGSGTARSRPRGRSHGRESAGRPPRPARTGGLR
ncbi:CPBP family glutamic-type intramembrane protease [Streptomyces sp. TRM 70361]|uniref:CPBP family glutamic-type intramembrane protease n=1 Tax=Streptomyces sp. TRM 70361 TaxID=3116553 RepID=UPI002E7B9991|nr:CPBP family glutamic-type intramembrane protease [Streptomyces sp. TRM 70361]MEE1941185.1 CPBP family glutamic-type intramembrane protease [Streptomyces sp. TRM 70361]